MEGDETPVTEGGEFSEGEEEESGPRRQKPKRDPCKCNQRIDELATPHKRMFLALWNEHAHHLPKDKIKSLKQLLQQLYAMSPEETAKYFAELRAEAKARADRRKIKQKLRKFLLEKHNQRKREKAYKLFKRLLKCGIKYAAQNPVPPLVSLRLRYLSDVILEQLCDLRRVEIPNRSHPDKLGFFLIAVADWMAIAVERLYYAAQLSINEMTEYEETGYGDRTENVASLTHQPLDTSAPRIPYYSFEEGRAPAAASTPKKNLDMSVPYSFRHIPPPQAASTPKKAAVGEAPHSFHQMGPPNAASTPKKARVAETPQSFQHLGPPKAASTPVTSVTEMIYSFRRLDAPERGRPKERPHLEIPLRNYSALEKTIPNFERTTSSMRAMGLAATITPKKKSKSKKCHGKGGTKVTNYEDLDKSGPRRNKSGTGGNAWKTIG